MLSNKFAYRLIFFWYLIPILFINILGIKIFNVQLIVLVFICSLTISYYFSKNVFISKSKSSKYNFNKFFSNILYLSFIICVFSLFNYYYINKGNSFDARLDFYTNSAKFFYSNYVATLYINFLSPSIILLLFWFTINNYSLDKKKIILLIILLTFDGILRQGRFQYLYIFFYLFLFKETLHLKTKYLFLGIIGLLILSFFTLYTRMFILDSAIESIWNIIDFDIIANTSLNYQIYGYIFLDKLIEDVPVYGNLIEFNTFSFIFYLINTFILTKIGLIYNYSWENYNVLIDKGMYSPELDFTFNAFTTNFYPLFLDFGFFGILLYGLVSGIILGIKTDNKIVIFLKSINLFVLLFGIYQPIITHFIGFLYIILSILFLFSLTMKIFKATLDVNSIYN